ncbi:MAG: DUF4350 domain-containing protein [Candidatus Fervidibacter sp.]|uniref:DUF4350 domain-containing protein n=2 Tax=Candidatus Fervidibacter sp. TaxID=3100871 RepID=UPI00404A5070
MRQRNFILLSATLLLLALLTFLTVRQREETFYRNMPALRSSFSTSPQGTKALYRTLSELGFKVARHRKSWRYLDTKQNRMVLFVIEPIAEAFPKPKDWKRLIEFAKCGNLVWISSEMTSAVFGKSIPSRSPTRTHTLFPTSWLKGVRSYIVKSRVRLKDQWKPPVSVTFPSVEPLREIPLLGDKFGTVLKVISVGKGFIVVDSNPYALSNEGISKGDNFLLVLNIVSDIAGREGVVLFDEWSKGLGEREHWWWVVTNSTRGAVLQIVIAGLVLLLAISIRFGKPVQTRSRSPGHTAFVQGLSTLLQRGNTLSKVVELLELQFLRQQLKDSSLWQLPDNHQLERLLASLPPHKRPQVRMVCQWAEKLRRQWKLSEREVLKWARAVSEVEPQ